MRAVAYSNQKEMTLFDPGCVTTLGVLGGMYPMLMLFADYQIVLTEYYNKRVFLSS